ncbi:MAG: FtsW/RodA/SpoVE family cell cycle protein [Oscillospiraceae bacterium]|nr:FtsW/RodA/SpoVE family cell cycle protein [Oscillospiraceae bacterium]
MQWKQMLPSVKEFLRRSDMVLFSLCLICSVFGLVVISSATATSSEGSAHYVLVQLLALLIGIGLYILFTVIDVDVIADKWAILYAISAGLLLILIPFGHDDGTGNKSWLRFFGIGIQPSEVVKVIYIVVLSKHIAYLKEYKSLNHILSVFQLVVHFAIPFGLVVVITRDLGSALIFFAIFLVLLFAAGLKFYWFVIGAAAMAAVIPFAWENLLADYQKERIIAPYVPEIDPRGDNVLFQATQSKLALASGRLTGTGLYQGPQTQSRAVPAQQTDFIFSVIGEELGMIGCYTVLLLLLLIILRCVWVGLNSKNTMSMLVCFGVAGMLLFQTAINVGMCTGLTPVIGLALPFFSYGGSSIFSLFAAVGLVSGIKYKPKPERFHRYG